MKLSDIERRILDKLMDGKSYREIGVCFEMSPNTVASHMRVVRAKLDAPNRALALVKYAELKRMQQ